MEKILSLSMTMLLLLSSFQTVLADGETPVVPTAAATTTVGNPLAGFPWALILVFIAAGFIITTIKKNTPDNVITTSCCVPFVDEKKMEIEKQKIAEEEAARLKA